MALCALNIFLNVTLCWMIHVGFAGTITAHLPLEMLNDSGESWFTSANKSVNFMGGNYKDIARAQYQEDIWAYENWFWNMSNGTMLESGALNGNWISTSFMFEKFANWRIIHIGKNYE